MDPPAQAELPTEKPEKRPSQRGHSPRLALLLAVAALAAAVVGALGPAQAVQTTYVWPPRVLPAKAPARLWYTPLLLIRHVPQRLRLSLPCSLPRRVPPPPSRTAPGRSHGRRSPGRSRRSRRSPPSRSSPSSGGHGGSSPVHPR